MRKIFIVFISVATLSGCVSTKKYDSMRAQAIRTESELELTGNRLAALEEAHTKLQTDYTALAVEKTRLEGEYANLRTSYDQLLDDASAEAARMLRQLEQNQRELDARSQRVNELEEALRAREAAIEAIRSKVTDALLGFEGKGLTITRRDGKVYVSMDDKLLFRSGSFEIDPNGAQAVRDLAAVLAANPDINIMVEGHTDNVPYRGSGQLRDNLDLSVKRATTVTRLLLENQGIAPARIISAGRGEWLPVDTADNEAARGRNRRTEIILTPKLDELLQLTE
jgi:chemotaxis protein MotB